MRALITGANRGIGLEYVQQLAERGDRVFAACRRPQEAEALQELKSTFGDLVTITAMEVTDPESIDASYNDVRSQTNAIDLLVNNAAVNLNDGGFGSFDPKVMQTVFTVNAIAPLLVAERYVDLLRAGDNPKIVNISSGAGSIAGRTTLATGYVYGASKAALNFITRNLSHEVKGDGIIVIAMSPGWVRTDMGGPNAQIDANESIAGMLRVIDGLTMDDSGEFFRYTGEHFDW
jgi:NAD(P)-dependent dehydrogenase (short-subunit alcohol dehydrogenase family)